MDLAPVRCESPSMISEEEAKYYLYLGRFYAGAGAVVELGPWLGASTAYITHGLLANPTFDGQRVHVFDDFTWRSDWMNRHLPPGMDPPADGSNFRPLFERYAAPDLDRLDVATRRIGAGDDAPTLTWDGGPIEMAFIDCGRAFEVNQAWYDVLSPHFIPDRTLVVLQDWRQHEQVPVRWFNQIKDFTDSLGSALDLVHEIAVGGVATFLYRGGEERDRAP
jgi:predicted O-methyltransferase YrrM